MNAAEFHANEAVQALLAQSVLSGMQFTTDVAPLQPKTPSTSTIGYEYDSAVNQHHTTTGSSHYQTRIATANSTSTSGYEYAGTNRILQRIPRRAAIGTIDPRREIFASKNWSPTTQNTIAPLGVQGGFLIRLLVDQFLRKLSPQGWRVLGPTALKVEKAISEACGQTPVTTYFKVLYAFSILYSKTKITPDIYSVGDAVALDVVNKLDRITCFIGHDYFHIMGLWSEKDFRILLTGKTNSLAELEKTISDI